MNHNTVIKEADLHAYVDGRLDTARRAEVHAYLTEHPQEAARVLDFQAINQALHTLYDDILDEPPPVRLLRSPPRRRYGQPLLRAAGIAGLLCLGGILGWLLRAQTMPSGAPPIAHSAVAQAFLAHAVYTPEVRHPVEVGADQEQHLVAWLSKRLDTEIRAPRLTEVGFELLGGRLLPGDQGPAAQFMYQDGSGRRLTLFVRKEAGASNDTAFRFESHDRSKAFYWVDHDLGYALIGDIDKATLATIADTVYRQLAFD